MDTEQLIKLVRAVSESGLTHFRYEEGDVSLELGREECVVREVNSPSPVKADAITDREPEQMEGIRIKSPLVGTFYSAPSPDEEPFIRVGDVVKKGQTIGIVEAMKLMNEIESECDGVVKEILVSDEELVEYGQPLFVIG